VRPHIDEKALQELAKERTVKTQSIEYDITTLKNKIDTGYIKLDPSYQRNYRWGVGTASRLIESLLLNIPIPLVYLSQDVDLDEDVSEGSPYYSVIDGQQRLTAIVEFLEGKYALEELSILKDLTGCRFSELPLFLKRRLEDRTISCLRIDSTLDGDVKYEIFERLNTGSVELEAQEIRNATFRGRFNDLIKKLAENEDFRTNTSLSEDRIRKMFHVELVLRYFAFTDGRYESYQPLLKDFLNRSMQEFQHLTDEELIQFSRRFVGAMADIRALLGDLPFAKMRKQSPNAANERLFASRFNAAVYDAVVVAIDSLGGIGGVRKDARERLDELFNDDVFQAAVSGAVTDTSKVMTRIKMVQNVFKQ